MDSEEIGKTFQSCMWILAALMTFATCNGAYVAEVQPHYGSTGGGTLITVTGSGFSTNKFSLDDNPYVGNRVYLVSNTGRQYYCPVINERCSGSVIVCYTPSDLPGTTFNVTIVVDGEAVSHYNSRDCWYRPSHSYTPLLNEISPYAALPGSNVTLRGRVFTDVYGPRSDDEQFVTLRRVYVGPSDCDLGDNEELENLSDDFIKCKTKGTSVGFFNASFLIDQHYGRSVAADNLYRLSYKDQIYMYQIYTEITGISHSSGSVAGGLSLTIFGKYFDDRAPYTKPNAYVGDSVCEVTNVIPDVSVECIVPPEPQHSALKFAGDRGVNFEYWTTLPNEFNGLDTILTFTKSDPGYHLEKLDETFFSSESWHHFVARMTTFFKPPHTGDYQFFLFAVNQAKLFVDGHSKVSCSSRWQKSERITLDANKKYHLQIVHYTSSRNPKIHLKVKYFGTKFTRTWIKKAEQEKQRIMITSIQSKEVQRIEFQNFTKQSYEYEVQIVEINTAGEYRFGIFGIYTAPLTNYMPATNIESALSDLPIWGEDESVNVTKNDSYPEFYTLTFISKRGDFPDIDVIQVDSVFPLTFNVTEETQGVPDLDTVALAINGVVSEPFAVTSLDAANLKDVILKMFEAKCPEMFESSSSVKYFEGFEADSSWYNRYRIRSVDAFCGKYALRNPKIVYQRQNENIFLTYYGTICFAYMGVFKNELTVGYTYIDYNSGTQKTHSLHMIHHFYAITPKRWYYTCADVYSEILASRPLDTMPRLDFLEVYSSNEISVNYVDSVSIGQIPVTEPREVHMSRLPPAFDDDIHDVAVTEVFTGVYDVTLETMPCANLDIPLFEAANGKLQDVMTNVSRSSMEYTFRGDEGSAIVTVTRMSKTSPRLSGSIDLTFNGHEKKGINVLLKDEEFKRELESLQTIGGVKVQKSSRGCFKVDISIEFLTLAGDLPELTVNCDQLRGKGPSCSVSTLTDGGLYYDPLSGDMLSTVHDAPQIRLYVNDVPSTCSGNCTFIWNSSITPTVTSVNPNTGAFALGTVIIISGTDFSEIDEENIVTIGGISCKVTAADNSVITCNIGNGPAGIYPVLVKVEGKGYAVGNTEFTYAANVTSIYPSSGSLGGGVILTIQGFGFTTDANVTIQGQGCEVLSTQTHKLTCIVPNVQTNGTFEVEVYQATSSLTYFGFAYDFDLTATVISISPQVIGIKGDTLKISGTDFTSIAGSVSIGSEEVTVVSWSDTYIEIYVTNVYPGVNELRINTSNGFAVNVSNLQLPTLTVEMSITNVLPCRGSVMGGTKITISGKGFGNNDTVVRVKIGSVDCTVATINDTEVTCDIIYTGIVHHVTNKGVDLAYGVYYAFDKPYIVIKEGDSVLWSWETPDFVNDIAHAIIEIKDPSHLVHKSGGFISGKPSRNGFYVHRFAQAGIYYVWSGYVDKWKIKNYVGTIEVMRTNSTSEEIRLSDENKEAIHELKDALYEEPETACVSTPMNKSTDNLSNKFLFTFSQSTTPIVSMIGSNNGTIKTNISITGGGFSTINEKNDVRFGGHKCIVFFSTEDNIVCNIDKQSEPNIGILHQLKVNVYNHGLARINLRDARSRGFVLIPNIETITPIHGSLAGGLRITVTGFGFGRFPVVLIGGYECQIIDASNTLIILESPPSDFEGQKQVDVFAFVTDFPVQALCEVQADTYCLFSYENLLTPVVYAVTPSEMSVSTSFFINGTLLGNIMENLEVTFGGVKANVTQAANSYITVNVNGISVGTNRVIVKVKGCGKAIGNLSVDGILNIHSVWPTSGSIYGGTIITIKGNGFVLNESNVKVGSVLCDVETISISEILCVTRSHQAGSVSITISSGRFSTSYNSYRYSPDSTPNIATIDRKSGFPGETLTIYGTKLSSNSVKVFLGQSKCDIITGNDTTIVCTIGDHSTGQVPVKVFVSSLGASNTNVFFEYGLSISTLDPIHGSTAGGQKVVLTGNGFDKAAQVTICGQVCTMIDVTFSSYICETIAHNDGVCDVVVSLNGLQRKLTNSYTYNSTLTPSLFDVSPKRGGTGGGTKLTITGSGFGSAAGSISVEIDGTNCTITNVTETNIECLTGLHYRSVQAKIVVHVAGYGIAKEIASSDVGFQYIDIWSSIFTWGGGPLPQEGEFVVIPSGMTLLLDIDTPVLSVLLIQGKLIFDEKDLELQSNIILISDGGLLQIGTEEKPFKHKAILTLHGHYRSKELPIYGTKVLAIRNGTLDLHGCAVPITWTRLSSTALAGGNTIELIDMIDWNIGDEIIISTSGLYKSQHESEKKTISAISENKMTLTLDSPLNANHIGDEEYFNGTSVRLRAEVGLLTHNIVVRGNRNFQWTGVAKKCRPGTHNDDYIPRTCFHGRLSEEAGSSQFGVIIVVHAAKYNTLLARLRISYTEITFAGQAYRQGRHPVFFHLNGNMSTSYLRGCSIHGTFNRAITIQDSNNILVEKTVIYDILGSGIVLEDGVETGNHFQHNLVVYVRSSSCLFHGDSIPASFLITNPDNVLQHNAVAGGSHYGYWYKIKNKPSGISFKKQVYPSQIPLGIFKNNSAHSFRRYGLWIFKDYFPLNSNIESTSFEGFVSWNNEKGAVVVNSSPMNFINFVFVQNKVAGYEGKLFHDMPYYVNDSTTFKGGLVVGTTNLQPDYIQGCTKTGLILPYGRGYRLSNVSFINFASSSCAAVRWVRLRECSWLCGGYTYYTDQLRFINAPNKAVYEWEWEGIIFDMDGTAAGKSANSTVLPTSGSVPNDCEIDTEFGAGIEASVCPPQHKWHRFAFHRVYPEQLRGRHFIIANEYGNSSVRFANDRLTHDNGWMCALLSGSTYTVYFEPEERRNNLSFSGLLYDFRVGEYIIFKIKVNDFPDRFEVNSIEKNMTFDGINVTEGVTGDWEWNKITKEISFLVKASHTDFKHSVDIPISLFIQKCFYKDCIPPPPPPPPDEIAPAKTRPPGFQYWHDHTIWNLTSDGYMTNVGEFGERIPQDYEDVRILFNTWVLVNRTDIHKIATLLLEGVLEFANIPGAVFDIEADFVIIKGGRLIIGWPNDPFDGIANIRLRGTQSSPHFHVESGYTVGPKSIGVFGGLDLIGKDFGITWTELATTAHVGSKMIKLKDPVKWASGNEIMISATSFSSQQTETFSIISINPDNVTLILNGSISFKHIVHTEHFPDGRNVSIGAVVGLLTRNIKIMGQDSNSIHAKSFGARVHVGRIIGKQWIYTGYARLVNVEFYNTGICDSRDLQMYEREFSITFANVGQVTVRKPSVVTKCSFHHGFNTAVVALGIGNLNVTDNVIFGRYGHGFVTASENTRVINNMIVATKENGIEATGAASLTLQDNIVIGSGKIGYHIPSENCAETRYRDNKMYGNVIGVFSRDHVHSDNCIKINGFTGWKNADIGIFYIGHAGVIFEHNILIENQIGAFIKSYSFKPVYEHVFATIRNSTFIGQTSSFDCLNDRIVPGMRNSISLRTVSLRLLNSNKMYGIVFPHLRSIGAITRMMDVTFSKYSMTDCNGNFAITTNIENSNGHAPINSEDITVYDVEHSNKIILQRADNERGDHCVRLNCDAFKYVVFRDLDGSFLGHTGSVVPESEYGRIDECRIPREMMTMPNGTMIPFKQLVREQGIVRNDNCIYQTTWQAYECFSGLNYKFISIQSVDQDAGYRQVSPVAMLSDGYLDLIDVPQDHIRCKFYTCRQRKSSFVAMVVMDKDYLVHFTGTTPRHMRYRLFNANADEGFKLTVWYSRPNRLDVFVDDKFVIATNAKIDRFDRYIISMPKGNEFEPRITDTAGTNFFDRNRGEITIIIKGNVRIDVRTQNTIIVSFGIPALTLEDFYGKNIVENLAAFFDIPLTKVRIARTVNEQTGTRRKRFDSNMIMEIEIGDEPVTDINSTLQDTIEFSDLVVIASNIVNECQLGNFSQALNTTITCETVGLQTDELGTGYIIYNAVPPDYLFFFEEPEADYEDALLKTQPKIRAADINHNVVPYLGTIEYPWQMTVSLRVDGTGHNATKLTGNLSVSSTDGWFNYTDLVISPLGSNFILDFNVTYPENAKHFTLTSRRFNVSARPLKINVRNETTGIVFTGDIFGATLELLDQRTDEIITNITWRQHSWSAEVGMLSSSPYANVTGTFNTSFDPETGLAIFPNLSFSGFGIYYLKLIVVSDPPEYNLTLNHRVTISSLKHSNSTIEEVCEVKVKLDEDFKDVLPTFDKQNEFEQKILTEYANTWTDVQLLNGSVNEGSIVVTYEFAGSRSAINSTLYGICSEIANGTIYNFDNKTFKLAPYMTVNNSAFYGVNCGEIPKDSNDRDSDKRGTLRHSIVIITAVVTSVCLIAGLFTISLIWRNCFMQKTHTQVRPQNSDNGQDIQEINDEEDKLQRIERKDPQTPAAAAFDPKKLRLTFSHFFLRIDSPEPLHPPGYTTGNEL
ncbi:fibrocystin-L-like [Mercenaria mercenaria]|uniref:fibrocystin-L-like n=1 Tax=Mercenaria mercenaria TaxID=6596 RepID=UPI00234F245D|nr:fibrocystin-L-like [Mercenaria mercenaria]